VQPDLISLFVVPLNHLDIPYMAMARRTRHEVGAVAVWVAPIEYVILRKLEWYREGGASRHLDDIRAMLRVSGGGWTEHRSKPGLPASSSTASGVRFPPGDSPAGGQR
jgi:hypothetical protein